jgi:hypothetical protein
MCFFLLLTARTGFITGFTGCVLFTLLFVHLSPPQWFEI